MATLTPQRRSWPDSASTFKKYAHEAHALGIASWPLARTACEALAAFMILLVGLSVGAVLIAGGFLAVASRLVWIGLVWGSYTLPRVAQRCVAMLLVLMMAGIAVVQAAAIPVRLLRARSGAILLAWPDFSRVQAAAATVVAYPGAMRRRRQRRVALAGLSASMVPLLASVVVCLAAVQFYIRVLPGAFSGLGLVQAPTFTSRSLDEATEAARIQGLKVVVASVQPTDDVTKDVVIGQTPAPGARMRTGEAVKLTVSAGVRPPSLLGKTLDEARVQLVRAGWVASPEVETRTANGAQAGVVIDQQPSPDEAAPLKGPVKLVVAAPNLAFRKPVLTSVGGQAPEATDGQPETVAWVPAKLPTWIEVNFGVPVTIAGVSLLLAQEKPGGAVVEVWGWDTANRFAPLYLFAQNTSDNTTLGARLPQPVGNIVRLRVVTTAAPSPIGWREISVTDR